jgi:hypothetical protein
MTDERLKGVARNIAASYRGFVEFYRRTRPPEEIEREVRRLRALIEEERARLDLSFSTELKTAEIEVALAKLRKQQPSSVRDIFAVIKGILTERDDALRNEKDPELRRAIMQVASANIRAAMRGGE